jgi:hypothetical protein
MLKVANVNNILIIKIPFLIHLSYQNHTSYKIKSVCFCYCILIKNCEFIKNKYTTKMKKLILWILIPSVAIQFIQMDVPATLKSTSNQEIETSKEVMQILKRSCYDCHSNSIVYPWYAKIAPASWYTQNHVKNGRKVVNFSIWKSYDTTKKQKVIKELSASLRIRMPLPDYLWLHPKAKLSKEDKKILNHWAEELKEDIEP